MEKNCKVVSDLLPLYLDEACSDESKKIVEEHLKECEKCRLLAEDMKKSISDERIPTQNDTQVLKKTAWIINKKSMKFAIGVTLIIIYWMVYFWQERLADIGDYRYFPYSFHEIFPSGIICIPVATFIWLAVLLIKTFKRRAWKKNAVPAIILSFLLFAQAGIFIYLSRGIGVSTITQVTEIPDEFHIVIKIGDNEYRTLETSPLVTPLIKDDGTRYSMSYTYNSFTPTKGTLSSIEEMETLEPPETD